MRGRAILDPMVREGLSGAVGSEQRPSMVWGREEGPGRVWVSPEARGA